MLRTFVHADRLSPTTLTEIRRLHDDIVPTTFIGAYAYATQSGVWSFEMEMGDEFWAATRSKWLFGIDYGRTQPNALRNVYSKQNAEVRIVDGTWLVNQRGFVPRRDFHAKLALLLNPEQQSSGMIVGSGNFSSNGLRRSIEAGASIHTQSADDHQAYLGSAVAYVEQLWDHATPVVEIIDAYEERWTASFARRIGQDAVAVLDGNELRDIFWIEAGYVTRNRGPGRPGNQIDFPRGVTARFFGFNPPNDLGPNSVIGPVTFDTPVAGPVQNNLRLGNNMMEKISLPIPETHGFDIYDGKILLFHRTHGTFIMSALEAADFEAAFGDRLDDVRVMGSGRRYGFIA